MVPDTAKVTINN